LNFLCSVADRGAAYLAGTSRSVGRGWSFRPSPTRIEEHQIFRDSFREFVAKEITPFVPQWEDARAVPREIWLKMGEQGFLCPWIPETYGGLDLGFEYSVIINEELIRGDGFLRFICWEKRGKASNI